jgi:hypothetical protein
LVVALIILSLVVSPLMGTTSVTGEDCFSWNNMPSGTTEVLYDEWSSYSAETHFTALISLLSHPFSENYDDNTLNSSLWVAIEQGGPTVAEVNQRLEITVPADSADPPFLPLRGFRAGYQSVAPIQGDYDVQVDFALLNWPAHDGVRIGINMQPDPYAEVPQDMTTGRSSNYGSWDEFYHAGVAGRGGTEIATSDSVGKLRQVRIGDSALGYYWNSSLGDWALINTCYGVSTDDMYVSLMAWSDNGFFGDRGALVAFDNLIVYSPGVNASPNQPANVQPTNGASGVSLTPTQQSSAFLDPDAGDAHSASQWQVTTKSGDYSNPAFDSGVDSGNLTSISVSAGKLSYSTTYYWHVRHQDNHGTWSEWSAETSYTTAPDHPPNTPANVAPSAGAVDISATPTLTSSTFSDPDSGDTHAASHWQITTTAGDYSSPVFESGTDTSNLTNISIPTGVLEYATDCYWHVRHQNNNGTWSQWSSETSFSTTVTLPPVVQSGEFCGDGTSFPVELSGGDTIAGAITSDRQEIGVCIKDPSGQVVQDFPRVAQATLGYAAQTSGTHSIVIYKTYGLLCTGYSLTYTVTLDFPPKAPSAESETGNPVVLRCSAFSDRDEGDTHLASQWQITSIAGDYSDPVFDSGTDTANLTEFIVPSETLSHSTMYYWRVRHQDNHGGWSAWSAEASLATSDAPFDFTPLIVSLAGLGIMGLAAYGGRRYARNRRLQRERVKAAEREVEKVYEAEKAAAARTGQGCRKGSREGLRGREGGCCCIYRERESRDNRDHR